MATSVDPITGKLLGGPSTDPVGSNGYSTSTPLQPNPTTPVGLSGDVQGDFNYQSTLNNTFKEGALLDSQSQLDAGRAKTDYAKLYTKAALAYSKQRQATKANASSRGMLRSGNYVKQTAEDATNNVNDVNNITDSSQRYFEDLARQTATRKQAAEQARLDAEIQQAQIKAQMDLQRAMIEAQSGNYAQVAGSLASNGSFNSADPFAAMYSAMANGKVVQLS